MHLIKDENGNVIPHGHGHEHEHDHTHEHTHDHPHAEECHTHDHCGSCDRGDCKNETVALLTYMLQHNQHHAAELDQMAANLEKLGLEEASRTIRDGVTDFEKGNMRLSLALSLVKEALEKGELEKNS